MDYESFFGHRVYDFSVCFLCGQLLLEGGSTEEHIFPRWLQKRFDLWNQKLELANRSTIPYKSLTIPCCKECNTKQLKPLEDAVSRALGKGPDAVRALGEKNLFLWLGKIFYGILYKELSLSANRRNSQFIPIISEEKIREYESLLFFLQEARQKIVIKDFCPGSVFVFRTQTHEKLPFQWDFCDNIDTLFIGIRMADVGIIGVLTDGSAQKLFGEFCKNLASHPLHPLQFRELCAIFSYRSTLLDRKPTYITKMEPPYEIYQIPIGGASNKDIFSSWDFDEFVEFMKIYTGLPVEKIRPRPGKMYTYLHTEDGKPYFIPYK